MKLSFALFTSLLAGAGLLAQLSPLHAQPAPIFPVLDLDGKDSYVELPAGAFTNLYEVTVEGWVKWAKFLSSSRFFDFTLAGYEINIQNRFDTSTLRMESFRGDDLASIAVSDFLPADRWTHIAVTAGNKGFSLYVDGILVGTEETPSQFSSTGLEKRNYLGRSNFKARYTDDADFHGQMTEVRVWKGVRTAAEIRENMFRRFTGNEEGLAGLWSFSDGTARDASPGAHHGKLVGTAKISGAMLPTPDTLVPWSRLMIPVTDNLGADARGVTTRAEVKGTEVGRAYGERGLVALTVWTAQSAVDLVATGSNDLGGWRFAVPIDHYAIRTNAWMLGPAIHLGGRATALDRKTPHVGLVVELVQPDETLSTATLSPSERERDGMSGQPKTAHVLELDGSTHAELPPGMFKSLTQATIEGWVRWDRLDAAASFVSLGTYGTMITINNGGGFMGGSPNDLAAGIMPAPLEGHWIYLQQVLRTNEWYHLAFLTGPEGMKLYVNGVLAGTNTYTGSFASLEKNNQNWFGRGTFGPAGITGRLGELRVWKTQRTAEQIRQTMFLSLSGAEPDLVGLWKNDDPARPARDATPGEHHAKLVGNPRVGTVPLPSLVSGSITDTSGKPVSGARVTIHQAGQPERQISASIQGEYAITLTSSAPCDLFVTSGTLSAYRMAFQPTGEARQRLDWTLADPEKSLVRLGTTSGWAGTDLPAPPSSRAQALSSSQFPNGTVVARTTTDESGNFDFQNVRPGGYQVRAQYPAEEPGATLGRFFSLCLANPVPRWCSLRPLNSGWPPSRRADGSDGRPWMACLRTMPGELFSDRTAPAGSTRPAACLVLTVANS